MHELELWACRTCQAERTFGYRTSEPRIGPRAAFLQCATCRKLTAHAFTGKFQPSNPYIKFRTPQEAWRGLRPAEKWQDKKPSRSIGFSKGRFGYFYAQERH